MAACPKCGKAKVRRRKDGRRKCPSCGFLPQSEGCRESRSGAIVVAAINGEVLAPLPPIPPTISPPPVTSVTQTPAPLLITEPGVYDLSEADYDADPCPEPSLRASMAKALVMKGSTPAHAMMLHPRLNPSLVDEPNRIFEFGRAAHRALLGRGAPIEVIPFASYQAKAAKIARLEAKAVGKTPVLESDYEAIQAMVPAARKQIDAAWKAGAFISEPFKEGHAEPTLIWKEGSVWCRAKLDFLPTDAEHIIDYKTTNASADPRLWEWRQMREKGMHLSLAFYRRGLEKLGIAMSPSYTFCVQETEAPYLLSVIHVDDELIERADEQMRQAIKIFEKCSRTGEWPGYNPEGYTVTLTDKERMIEQSQFGAGHMSSDDIAASL